MMWEETLIKLLRKYLIKLRTRTNLKRTKFRKEVKIKSKISISGLVYLNMLLLIPNAMSNKMEAQVN